MGRLTAVALATSACLLVLAGTQRLPWLAQQIQQAGGPRLGNVGTAPAQPFAAVKSPSWSTIDATVERLQAWLKDNPQDPRAATVYAQLGGLYLQKARETGDPSYYTKTEGALTRALELAPDNVPALVGMGTLQLARHDFAEALATGQRALQLAPNSYAVFGVIGDANVELGRYPEAVEAFQQMVDRRPDLSSLSRVSYARELHGDLPGAIVAMKQAADAGPPRTESTAWTRVQLGNLYFISGDLEQAELQYQQALLMLPNYVHALGGQGKVAAARGDLRGAIALYSRALEVVPLPEYAMALGDLYRATGDARRATQQDDLVRVIAQLQQGNGMDVDLEMALFEADRAKDAGALAVALERARATYARRPSIHAADVLAWTLYRAGQPLEALPYAREALRLGSKDPHLLYRAGAVAAAAGEPAEARAALEGALRHNPAFSVRYAPEAKRLLQGLKGA